MILFDSFLKMCIRFFGTLCICCAFIRLDNKLYKMHGAYVKIYKKFPVPWPISGSTELHTHTHKQLLCSCWNSKCVTEVLHDDGHKMKTCNGSGTSTEQWQSVCLVVAQWGRPTVTVCVGQHSGTELYMNVSVSSRNFVWHLVSDLFLQPLLIVRLSLGQLLVFCTVLYSYIQLCTVMCSSVQVMYSSVQVMYSYVQFCTVMYSSVQVMYSYVQFCTVLYKLCTFLYKLCTVLYSYVQVMYISVQVVYSSVQLCTSMYSYVQVLNYYSYSHFENKIYILTAWKLPENCNLLLMMILLMSLTIKKMKILFCNIVVKQSMSNFDVLLTVHLSIILGINQLNAQIFFYNKFISCLYMFRALLC